MMQQTVHNEDERVDNEEEGQKYRLYSKGYLLPKIRNSFQTMKVASDHNEIY